MSLSGTPISTTNSHWIADVLMESMLHGGLRGNTPLGVIAKHFLQENRHGKKETCYWIRRTLSLPRLFLGTRWGGARAGTHPGRLGVPPPQTLGWGGEGAGGLKYGGRKNLKLRLDPNEPHWKTQKREYLGGGAVGLTPPQGHPP